MKSLISIILVLLCQISIANSNRVEDIFIWKISEELKLNIKEEKKLADIIKTISSEKNKVASEMEQQILDLSKANDSKSKQKIMTEYKLALKKYSDFATKELEQIQKVIGEEKLAQYLVVKNDLTARIRSMLASPEKVKPDNRPQAEPDFVPVKDLPEPKYIEE